MDLEGLYQEIILDHYKHPRGKGELTSPLAEVHHVNPTCGDEITVQIATDPAGHLLVGYQGLGCSISQASASVMSELVNGNSIEVAETARAAFVDMMHAQGSGEPNEEILGDGIAFAGVAKYPARVKCALLPWMALRDAQIQANLAESEEG